MGGMRGGGPCKNSLQPDGIRDVCGESGVVAQADHAQAKRTVAVSRSHHRASLGGGQMRSLHLLIVGLTAALTASSTLAQTPERLKVDDEVVYGIRTHSSINVAGIYRYALH